MYERRISTRDAVANELRARIESGQIRVGSRIPSERVLAEELKVSRASIQGALRELEAMGFLERKENCRPLAKLPRATPAASSSRATQVAVWIHPSLQEIGAATMLQGIRSRIGSNGFQLLVGCAPSLALEVVHQSEGQFLRSLVHNPAIAGAILWDTGNPAFGSSYGALAEAGIPVVFIDREPLAAVEADVVATNNRKAARTAMRHLIGLGHERIAMVVNDDPASSVVERIEGYCAALQEAEIPFRAQYIVRLPVAAGQVVQPEYEPLIRSLLSGDEAPTAIFAVNDQIAFYLREAAKRAGLRIPEDLSLVGFDWLMRWLPAGGELTTITQPFEEIGRVAAERLLDRIETPAPFIPRQILLDAPLVVRSTTGAPRVAAAPIPVS